LAQSSEPEIHSLFTGSFGSGSENHSRELNPIGSGRGFDSEKRAGIKATAITALEMSIASSCFEERHGLSVRPVFANLAILLDILRPCLVKAVSVFCEETVQIMIVGLVEVVSDEITVPAHRKRSAHR